MASIDRFFYHAQLKMRTAQEVDLLMLQIPVRNRKRYCRADFCACMGCVNRYNGTPPITEEEWAEWKERHPDHYFESQRVSWL